MNEENAYKYEVREEILENFAKKLIDNQVQLDPDIAKVLNENFWDMI